MKLIQAPSLLCTLVANVSPLRQECEELTAIFIYIIKRAETF